MKSSDTRVNTVKEFMEKKSLWREPYDLSKEYYGVHQGKTYGKERDKLVCYLAPLMEVLRIALPNITMFCNFVKNSKGVDNVRYLCEYDSNTHFEGVAYITIEDLLEELSNE